MVWSACKTRGPTEYFGRSLINSISSSVKFMWSDKRKFSGRVSASLMSSPFSSRTANGISAKSSARPPALMWMPSAAFLNSSPASVVSPFLMSAPALLSSGFKERIVSPAKRRVFVGSPPFKIKKHSTSRRKSWLRKNELLMQRQRISRRPAPPGISFKEKVGSVVALWPTTANLSIIEYTYWLGFVFKVCYICGTKKWIYFLYSNSPIRSRITTDAHAIPNIAGVYDKVPMFDLLFCSSHNTTASFLTGSAENTAANPFSIPSL